MGYGHLRDDIKTICSTSITNVSTIAGIPQTVVKRINNANSTRTPEAFPNSLPHALSAWCYDLTHSANMETQDDIKLAMEATTAICALASLTHALPTPEDPDNYDLCDEDMEILGHAMETLAIAMLTLRETLDTENYPKLGETIPSTYNPNKHINANTLCTTVLIYNAVSLADKTTRAIERYDSIYSQETSPATGVTQKSAAKLLATIPDTAPGSILKQAILSILGEGTTIALSTSSTYNPTD
jgi:hypothetical protein